MVLGSGALAGAALAHVLDYLVVVPDSSRRAAVLAETGHAWDHLVALGCSAATVAIAGSLCLGIRRSLWPGQASPEPDGLLSDVRVVALLQMALFGGMEIIERVLSHASLAGLVLGRPFLVGLALQVLVAWVVVAVLRTSEAAGRRLFAIRRRRARSCSQRWELWLSVVVSAAVPARRGGRSPPPARLTPVL